MNYDVQFLYDKGEKRTEVVEADNPGAAFATVLKNHPEVKLLKAATYSTVCRRAFSMVFDPPPVQRQPEKPHRRSKRNDTTEKFPFMKDEEPKGETK